MHRVPLTIWCALVALTCAASDAAPAFAPPAQLVAQDARDDAGGALFLSWPASASESDAWDYIVWAAADANGEFKPIQRFPSTSPARLRSAFRQQFGFSDSTDAWRATEVSRLDVDSPDEFKALRAEVKETGARFDALQGHCDAKEKLQAHVAEHGDLAASQSRLKELEAKLDQMSQVAPDGEEAASAELQGLKDEVAELKEVKSERTKFQDALQETAEQCQAAFGVEPDRIEDVGKTLADLRITRRELADAIKQATRREQARVCCFRVGVTPHDSKEPGAPFPGLEASAAARPNWFKWSDLNTFLSMLVLSGVILGSIAVARRKELFLRKIAGLDAVDEALGRATEMGKPVLFVHGLSGVSDVAVIASVNILGRMARRVAEYDTSLLVVNNEPVVYSLSAEVVREGYVEAGRPDRFRQDDIYMVASRQFPYVAAVAGIMARELPAANFFMGYFYAESLILAESGATTGAIQIAGTDAFTQLPFFVTTCDYTLMGEELYAASAYLSREPKLMGTLRGQDIGKACLIAILVLGTILISLKQDWFVNLFETF